MSTEWAEGKLSFGFDDSWHAIKWDDHDGYQSCLGKVQGCKAVDFCGVRASELYLIEVKDFRGHRIETKERLAEQGPENLADEVAHKVCDTVAGLVGAHRTRAQEEALWKPFGESLSNPRLDVRVILWLEEDLNANPTRRMTVGDQLKKKLRWLTPKVLLADRRATRTPPGLTVLNLPGAGGLGAS